MSEKTKAQTRADNLLSLIIQNQPELLKSGAAIHESGGKDMGNFIAALRDRLIAMYEQDERR